MLAGQNDNGSDLSDLKGRCARYAADQLLPRLTIR